MKIKIILIILISLILNLKSVNAVHAQGVDIGIYPPIFEVQATTPSDINAPFTIENFTENPVDLKLSLKPFTASQDENGQVTFADDSSNFPDPNLFQKVIITDNGNQIDTITLSPKQKKELNLRIIIPVDQPKGDYYFSIVFTSNPVGNNTSNSTGASAGIASNVLLTVGPTGKTDGIIEDFSSPFLTFKGPVPFTIRLRNTSDHFITIKGDIIIKNFFGQAVGKVLLLPENVLSNSVRRIPDSLQSTTTSDKDYEKIKAVVEKNQFPVSIWPEKFLLGPYTANLTLSLSNEGPVFRKRIAFFAFPLEYLLGLLLIIGLTIYIVIRVKKRMSLKV